MKRRSFLQAFAAAPAVIKSTAEAAMHSSAVSGVIVDPCHTASSSSGDIAVSKIKSLLGTDASFIKTMIEAEIADAQDDTFFNNPNNWPATVQAKRSWSYAAKRNEAIRLRAEQRVRARMEGGGSRIGQIMESLTGNKWTWGML